MDKSKTRHPIETFMYIKYLFLLIAIAPSCLYGQSDSIRTISFSADFRFRAEQDWDSRKSDGTLRKERSRLRYRLRAGFTYRHNQWASAGARLRTGHQARQQDSQLTLGEGLHEFGPLPFALEKAYFKAETRHLEFWAGKNSWPFQKQNELFWSDNVYPEGVYLGTPFGKINELVSDMEAGIGHFILNTAGRSFADDSYMQTAQVNATFHEKLRIFPAWYIFRNIPDIPDGKGSYLIDYSIFHIGAGYRALPAGPLAVAFDFYYNTEDYAKHDSVPSELDDQVQGWSAGIGYGKLEAAGDWMFQATYASMERYAAVDFMAQNDWARWDYSSKGSPDGRLTNMRGIELLAGLQLDEGIRLKLKFYTVEQIIVTGLSRENGSRIRLDLDISF